MFWTWWWACGVDLPAGWQDAVPVDSLEQAACEGSPYDTGVVPEVTADLGSDPLHVDATAVQFRCGQDVEGFWKENGASVEVLVQPVDMNPTSVAACDCLYDLAIDVGTPEGTPEEIVLWRRWDAINDPNDPVEVGRVPAAARSSLRPRPGSARVRTGRSGPS